jgi:hypothetical protein
MDPYASRHLLLDLNVSILAQWKGVLFRNPFLDVRPAVLPTSLDIKLTLYSSAAFQGGFIPDVVLYLSYWYNKYDFAIRMAIFYTVNPFTNIITAFLGAGLNQMRGVLGYAGWRWMFLIEGLFTLLIGGEYLKPSYTAASY